jgi:hypothetical protein
LKSIIYILLFVVGLSLISAKDCIPGRQFELIVNGDFEMGDTLFNTEYRFSTKGKNEKTYSVTDNPYLSYNKFDSCGDHTTGFGKMLLVNGDTVPGTLVWQQTVRNLKKNLDYELRFWHTPVNKLRSPVLYAFINDDTLKPYPIFMPDSSCNWQEFVSKWFSGQSDTAEIKLYNGALHIAGNDFALDDFSLQEYCRIQACAGNDLYLCKDKSIRLSGNASDGYEPYSYSWFPPIGLDNANSQNPLATPGQTTKYYLTVTDRNGCSSFDTITVNIYNLPDNTIRADKSIPICPCDSVKISAQPGYSYLWSTGESTQSINVNLPGSYSVEVTDKDGCKSSNSITVTQKPVRIEVALDTVISENGKNSSFKLSLVDELNAIDCGYTDISADISFNQTLIIPDNQYPVTIKNGLETIRIKHDFNVNKEKEIPFTGTLGNSICTSLELSSITVDCDSMKVKFTNGRVCITGICYEGGPRLIDMTKEVFFSLSYNISGNLKVDFGTIEKDITNITIYDYTGKNYGTIISAELIPGKYSIDLDLEELSSGMYFVVFRSGLYFRASSFIK